MKVKARLYGFSSLEDEIDAEEDSAEVPRHFPMTYEGICNKDNASREDYCPVRPTKCLHGIFDQGNLNKNIRMLDQYY